MRVALALMAACVQALAVAQQQEADDEGTFVPVTPIERANPNYPSRALQYGNEGWVTLSFIVSETGEVQEAMIEDSSGVEAFELAALEAVRRWRYAPATVNGEPVAHSMRGSTITFALEGVFATGATRQFGAAYRKVRQLLDAGDFAAAEPLLAAMEVGGRHNLYEDALFWALKYAYLEGVQSTDTAEKIRALQLAMGYQAERHLPTSIFVTVAQRLYVLQVQALDLAAARKTFESLRDSDNAKKSSEYSRVRAELTPTYEQIADVIAGPDLLPVKGEIGRYDYWVHRLMRRAFSMTDVNGRIDSVSVRCERGTGGYDVYSDGAVWRVPETWGECGVYVAGERGATFTFLEHPAGTPGTQLTRE